MNGKRSIALTFAALALGCALAAPARAAQAPEAPAPAQAPAAQPQGPLRVALAGRVVDGAGNPVAGARLSSFWTFDQADPLGRPAQRLESDAEGAFRGDVQLPAPGPFALVAYSADGTQAGLVELASGADLASIRVALRPGVRVLGAIASPELDHPLRWTNTFWSLAGSGLTVASAASTEARFDLVLPTGHFTWFAYGEEVRSRTGQVELAPGTPRRDLGTIEIAATYLAQNRGKELPAWQVSEARGVPLEEATLASFRGRWLLVAFFDYRSGPAVLIELPRLIQFHEQARGTPRAERFRLVAFHDASLPSLAAVDRAMADVRERVWGGRTLPFPLLLDATGATFDRYGIESLPTLVLVDPAGKLVGEATLDDLVQALEREEAEVGRDLQAPPREGR